MSDATLAETVFGRISTALPGVQVALLHNPGPAGQHSLLLRPSDAGAVFGFVRDTLEFDLLSNLTGVDWPDPANAAKVGTLPDGVAGPETGFLEVVYHLYSTAGGAEPLVLRMRTQDRAENARLPSVVGWFRSAEFQEREVFDLFGVTFDGHPDLRRILMWDEFEDHPMRKDYVAPDDYEYEPTPHDAVLERARRHYPEDCR